MSTSRRRGTPAKEGQALPTTQTPVNALSTSRALILVLIIFLASLCTLGILYKQFPELEENEKQYLKLPWELEDAKQLGLVLDRYKDKYFYQVLLGISLVYVLDGWNEFAGSFVSLHYFLFNYGLDFALVFIIGIFNLFTPSRWLGAQFDDTNSIVGFLFPFYLALFLICCCSAIGASMCFFISNLLGKKLVSKFFPERAAQWAKAVTKHKNNLLNYIIFLRVTPFLPNWFINLTAPVIGVPLVPFALGTFIGVAPPSFVAIQAGQTLHTLTSTNDAWSWTSITVLSIFAIVSLVPVILKEKLRKKFD